MIVYLKAPPVDQKTELGRIRLGFFWSRLINLLPTIMITVGASILISIGYPILSYELTTAQKVRRQGIISPVPKESLAENKGILSPSSIQHNPQVLATNSNHNSSDYSKISSWFNFSRPQIPSNTTHYTLSIPKLRIDSATVIIGGDDLEEGLIQYGGTANPGEPGNTVIFGHSVLPQFYNPKSYRSIFSLIPTLKPGDQIIINFDGITYIYEVYDYQEVLPNQIDILEQKYSRKELTLVTCVPPGTYWRRGIIKAKLVEI